MARSLPLSIAFEVSMIASYPKLISLKEESMSFIVGPHFSQAIDCA